MLDFLRFRRRPVLKVDIVIRSDRFSFETDRPADEASTGAVLMLIDKFFERLAPVDLDEELQRLAKARTDLAAAVERTNNIGGQ